MVSIPNKNVILNGVRFKQVSLINWLPFLNLNANVNIGRQRRRTGKISKTLTTINKISKTSNKQVLRLHKLIFRNISEITLVTLDFRCIWGSVYTNFTAQFLYTKLIDYLFWKHPLAANIGGLMLEIHKYTHKSYSRLFLLNCVW
jgi:hypothetical protein